MNDLTQLLGMLLGFVVIMILLFLLFREYVCWYFKINEQVSLLSQLTESSTSRSQNVWKNESTISQSLTSNELYLLLNSTRPLWLRGIHLNKTNLAGADFSSSNLEEADLSEAVLTKVNFTNANLRGAYLYEANLEGAVLFGANFEDATLDDALLKNALYDSKTIWPQGFDLKESDAILKQ